MEGKLSEDEEVRFNAWLKENREHQTYYERMKELFERENAREVSEEEVQEAWCMFEKRIKGYHGVIWKRYRVWGISVAASVIIAFCCFFMYYAGGWEKKVKKPMQEIVPGQYNAILEMADGKTYHLGEKRYSLQEKTGNRINVDSSFLSYLPMQNVREASHKIVFNKLSIPRGGEYRIELEDGTKVWINSASCLRYPVVFTGGSREVYLEGEAYFEVRRDSVRPFIVHAGKQKVTVLGTDFGITCYANEENDYTTLVSGSVWVEFEQGKRTFELKPGMQVMYNKANGTVKERKVNVAEFVAWKDGKYVFKQKRLEDILSTLSKWYNFEVFYRNASVKNVLFSGELRRFDDFNYLLRLIERTSDVKFIIDKKVVQVMR